MTGRTPAISVVMPVFNGCKYLHDSITSILQQSFGDFELVIVNDASTDGTDDLLAKVEDRRVRVLRNPHRLGVALSLNHGIDQSEAPFIARMDSDDIAEPHRFARQIEFLRENPSVTAVGSWARGMRADGTSHSFNLTPPVSSDAIARLSWRQCPLVHPTVMLRRDLLGSQRYDPGFAAEDYELWCRMIRAGVRLANLPEFLLRYRFHNEQVTSFESDKIRAAAFRVFDSCYPELHLSRAEYDGLVMVSLTMPPRDRWQLIRRCARVLSFPSGGVMLDQLKYVLLSFLRSSGLLKLSRWSGVVFRE